MMGGSLSGFPHDNIIVNPSRFRRCLHGTWTGIVLLSLTKALTTENTEDHGGPRRFFGLRCGARHHVTDQITQGVVARTVPGPGSPWPSVVLRVLRGKTSRCRTEIQDLWSRQENRARPPKPRRLDCFDSSQPIMDESSAAPISCESPAGPIS